MKRAISLVTAFALSVTAAATIGAGVAAADPQVTIPISCDRPNGGITNGLLADLNALIPDPLETESLMQVTESADPVLPGGQVQYSLQLPFPDLSEGLPPNDFGVTYGTLYVKSVDLTVPIPAGLQLSTVTPIESPQTDYVTVTRDGGNLKIRVQSQRTDAHPNSYIRINTEVASPVPEVRLLNGQWVPVSMPAILVSPTVTAAPGSTITWKPPSNNQLVVKYNRDFGFLVGSINWNDQSMPCVPVNPNQAVATTTVASPALSVTKTADETSVVAGAAIHFHVTVTNTGNVPLTGVTVSDANAPGCAGAPGNLAVGAQVTLNCTVTTSAANIPTLSNTAGADSNETSPVTSNTVNVTVTPAGPTGVSGTVLDADSGTPIPGAWVAMLRTSDFTLAAGLVADGAGEFSGEVPAGSYFAYAIDPTGRHTAGFFGGPTPVVVTAGSMTTADPALQPTRGKIAGTVTTQGTGAPIPGAWALASSATTFAPELLAVADGSGQFEMDDLTAGGHFVAYVDPSGAHAPEYFGDSPAPVGAVTANVSGGTTTTANGTPPAQTPVGTGATLSGNVIESGTNEPLADVAVIAMRAADYGFARAELTDASGNYSLDVAPGSYKLVFLDRTGGHHMEWHDNQPYTSIATAASVVAPSVTNAALEPNTGTMTGTITDDGSGAPVAGAWVVAIGPSGIAGGAFTAANGSYTITGLEAGTYRATFVDPNEGRLQEYWNNAADYGTSTPITIAGGASTVIDAALGLP